MSVLLFAGQNYYACGGFNDFKGSFPSIADAKLWMIEYAVEKGPYFDGHEWWHIIDSETYEPLAYSNWQAHGCDEDSYVPEPRDDH